MLRRQLISDELRYSHQTSPRKVRTYGATGLFQPTILYRGDVTTAPSNKRWVGRILAPWNGNIIQSYIRSVQLGRNNPEVVSEFEIANFAKPHIYRILYTDTPGDPASTVPGFNGISIKSKPEVLYIPERLNIIVNPVNNMILDTAYF